MTLWILLSLASGVLGIFFLWLFWMTWRSERIRLEAIFLINATYKISASSEDFQKQFPHMATYAREALPWIQRNLVEAVAKKHNKKAKALEKALLADTGAASLDEALRTPMGSATMIEVLWADYDATHDGLQLAVRNWLQKSGLSIPQIHRLEKILFAVAIVVTISAAVTCLVFGVK